jgi:hypothetical protein
LRLPRLPTAGVAETHQAKAWCPIYLSITHGMPALNGEKVIAATRTQVMELMRINWPR